MKKTEAGQSMVETAILNALIVAGVIAILAVCQERISDYTHFILNLLTTPVP